MQNQGIKERVNRVCNCVDGMEKAKTTAEVSQGPAIRDRVSEEKVQHPQLLVRLLADKVGRGNTLGPWAGESTGPKRLFCNAAISKRSWGERGGRKHVAPDRHKGTRLRCPDWNQNVKMDGEGRAAGNGGGRLSKKRRGKQKD